MFSDTQLKFTHSKNGNVCWNLVKGKELLCLLDDYGSYFVGHLNIVIKILVYSKIINRIFNFTSNFKVSLTPEKFQFVHASCTLIYFFSTFSAYYSPKDKTDGKQRNELCTYPELSKMDNFIYNWANSISSITLVSMKVSVFSQ